MSVFHDILAPMAKLSLTWLGRRRLSEHQGEMHLPGIQDQVSILRDKWGIPHIYAENSADLFFAQGFVHAQDRMWQMEINRRTAQGRLSELFGELALDTDRATRTFGFGRLGRADLELISEASREIIIAYTAGVNAFLEHESTNLPLEFTLLRHRPEPWTPEDTMAFSRVMIWQLSHAWYSEIVRAQVIQAVGEAHAAELEIHYPADNPVTLPDGIEFNTLSLDGDVVTGNGPFLNQGLGSNAWAVAGRRTVTGKPYLCNDMHLPIGLPALWYEAHLNGGDVHVTGVTLPGAPLVMVGHNAYLAWGMTLAFTDCEDLFIEQMDPQDSHRYRFQDDWRQAEVVVEAIHVKDRTEPFQEEVVITHHGPIISDVVGYPDQRLAVCSMALQPGRVFDGWRALNMAGSWDEFVEAARLIEAPQLNVAYADVDGNIGYWVTGKVPVRGRGDGSIPVPGWTGDYDWVDEVPFEEMPYALNPGRGMVVTCNHRLTSDDYPHFLGNVWMNGYRARRVEEVLGDRDDLSVADFRALHMDFDSIPGRMLVKLLDDFKNADPDIELGLDLLRSWDGQLSPDSVGGCMYEVFRYSLVRALLEPGLGEKLTNRLMGQGFHPVLSGSHEFYGHDTVALLRLLEDPSSWWVAEAGGREALLARSLKKAVGWLRNELGSDVNGWRWGRLHRVTFNHPLGLQKPLDRVLDRGPFPIGGDTDTVCQTAMHPHEPYDNNAWAPSFRQIIDLEDFSRSLAMFPPGQSGQLGSPHYDDLIAPWLRGDYHPMLWDREQVEAGAKARMVLTPKG